MATHLSDDVLRDLVEAGKSHPHIAECDRCRRLFEDAREALSMTRADQLPEPSPLFWDHFSARVHQAVRDEADLRPHPAFGWFAAPVWRSVVAVALVIVVAAVVVWGGRPARQRQPQSASVRATGTRPMTGSAIATDNQASADALVAAGDPSWSVIAQVTAQMEITSAADAGIVLRPGTTERAIAQLSPLEQQELVRLLQADLDGPSS
jgi:predicted anti-sigma-YlaC factor YlaD